MAYQIKQYIHNAGTTNYLTSCFNNENVNNSKIQFSLSTSVNGNSKAAYYFHINLNSITQDGSDVEDFIGIPIEIYLYKDNEENLIQFIKTVTLRNKMELDCVFSPFFEATGIILKSDKYSINIGKVEGFFINNILNTSNKTIIKLGVQGPPNTPLCINGQEIRIGYNGIYELRNENMTINFFGAVLDINEKTTFLVDYLYKENT